MRVCIGCLRSGKEVDLLGVKHPICGECFGLLTQYRTECIESDIAEEDNMTDELRIAAQRARNNKRIERHAAVAASVANVPDPLADQNVLA